MKFYDELNAETEADQHQMFEAKNKESELVEGYGEKQ